MKQLFGSYRDIIPDFSLFQESLRRPLPVHIRLNVLKKEPVQVLRMLNKNGIFCKRSVESDETLYVINEVNSPGNLLEYFLGYIHPQALTSCLASKALFPQKKSYVLDMCASPGGKTSHMAQLMENTGMIIANELYHSRHASLGHTLERMGVLNTVITEYQAQEFPLRNRFDFILADVPCSGEGRFRVKTEKSTYKKTKARLALPELQKKIILRGFDLLEDDGIMLYSTCTYNPEENEAVVNFLLEKREAELLPINAGLNYDPGITGWGDEIYEKQVERAARMYPHRYDSVGFFMARIGRRG